MKINTDTIIPDREEREEIVRDFSDRYLRKEACLFRYLLLWHAVKTKKQDPLFEQREKDIGDKLAYLRFHNRITPGGQA